MRLELCVVQLFQSVFHVVTFRELNHASPIAIDVRIDNIAGLNFMFFCTVLRMRILSAFTSRM
jgi:hypothetical protein